MHRLVLLTLLLVAVPGMAQAQWTFDKVFPDSTSGDNTQNHGLAVDPAGNVWMQAYYPFTGDSVFVDVVGSNQRVTALYCYKPDGTQCDFSPLSIVSFPGGVQDTLGGTVIRNATGDQVWDYRSGRGLRVDPNGNILAVFFNTLYRINYQTGEGMNMVDLGTVAPLDPRGATAPAVDGFGNIFITGVFAGDPLVVLNPDFTLRETAVQVTNGFSRAFEVSEDGNTIYWAGYSNKRVDVYSRASEFDEFGQQPDSVLNGFAAESFAWNPDTKNLWISAGSPNDKPGSNYQMNTWYAFDVNDFTVKQDSLTWEEENSQGRPRAIAFTASGDTVYVGQFNQSFYAVQRFLRGTTNAVSPTGAVPAGFTLERSYPNPTTGVTNIEFALPVAARATLKVYDTLGREVATVLDQMLAPDTYTVDFDASALPSGLYVYRLSADGHTRTGTMTVVR